MYRLAIVVAALCLAVFVMREPRPTDSFAARAEQARVRAHFDSAEREVRSNSVTRLSPAQRAARARALDRLHAYAARGVFPRNRDFPDSLVPYFIDTRTGTRCAMAHLIEQSGEAGFVARVAATNNNASVPDLKDDPEMIAWLERNGLTLEEAARIQPKYDCLTHPGWAYCTGPRTSPPATASNTYKLATGGLVSADVVIVALNAMATRQSRPVAGVLGVVTGVVGMAIGVPNIDESGSKQTLGWVNTGMGAVSAAVGAYRLLGTRSNEAPVSFTPLLSLSGAPGLSGRITF